MKFLALVLTSATLMLCVQAAGADAIADAKAGLDALNRGDNTSAVSLFTKALGSGHLAKSDKELAYAKRAQAYLALGAKDKALSDANRALAMDPNDSEAAAARDQAQPASTNGPSIEVTMKFIQDKLNELRPVTFAESYFQVRTGMRETSTKISETENVVSDAASCKITYRSKDIVNGNIRIDDYETVDLHDIQTVVVKERVQMLNETPIFRAADVHDDPAIFLLLARAPQGKSGAGFTFLDEQMANRVAKAMTHAVELCGGGKEPF